MKTCLVLTLGVLISITRVWSLNFQVFEEGNADEIVGNIPQQNGQTYRLSEPSSFFTLIEATGELKTTQGIDREAIPNDVIQLIAVSTASVAPVEINVQVVDTNDNAPIFNQPAHVDVDIPESTEAGAQYFLPTATDRDSPANSVSAKYSIVEGDTNKFGLLVDSSPGQETLLFLVTKTKFNREIQVR
uniref:protocadherin-7-like n=1 Tax=Ciona intestinalis TaxID=7719 RepID=UPI00089DAE8A|nr:protocadherin-7-like [Ciona intestinalis]|eukprot:XP_018670248.1 protocadherin-7-like [Ciona intestinalis]